jgi:hypothetical protein
MTITETLTPQSTQSTQSTQSQRHKEKNTCLSRI